MGTVLYRVVDPWDPGDPPLIDEIGVLRETAKCYVVHGHNARMERMVLKDPAGKRYAYRSLDDAKNSYRRRKQRQIAICRSRIDAAEASLRKLDGAKSMYFQLEVA